MTAGSDIITAATTVVPCSSINDTAPVLSRATTLSTGQVPTLPILASANALMNGPSCNADKERTKSECLEICRTINSVTPGISAYWTESNELGDAFMLFSLYDKLRTTEVVIQSIAVGMLDSRIIESELGTNIEADLARKNLKLLFQSFEVTLKRIRDIAPTLSMNRPMVQAPPHPVCGYPHNMPPT